MGDRCPVGLGETWRRMLVKCVLVVIRAEAKEACKTEHLFGGLEAGIEEGIHSVRLLWQQHAQLEDLVFLFVDACNSFN